MTVYMMRRGVSVRPSLDRMIHDTLVECSDFPMQDNRSVNHTAEKAIEGERERERERESIYIYTYLCLPPSPSARPKHLFNESVLSCTPPAETSKGVSRSMSDVCCILIDHPSTYQFLSRDVTC